MNHKIFIAGSGGIGNAVAILLREWSNGNVDVFLGDISEDNLHKTKQFVTHQSEQTSRVETVLMSKDGINEKLSVI